MEVETQTNNIICAANSPEEIEKESETMQSSYAEISLFEHELLQPRPKMLFRRIWDV